MKRRTLAWALAVLAAIGGSACDGIGRPLVGKKKSETKKGQDGLCVLAPSCEDNRVDDLGSEILPLDPSPVDLPACGATLEVCVPFSDDLGSFTSRGCISAWPTHDTGAAVNGNVFDCTGITLDNHDPGVTTIKTSGVELQQTAFTIASTSPLRVELEGALIDDVIFRLEGPVTLRLSRTRALHHVRVIGAMNASRGSAQRLELSQIDGDDLSVSGEYGLFAGTVSMERGAIENARIVALDIEATEIALSRTNLSCENLTAKSSTLSLAMLTFTDGQLLGSTVERAQVTDCNSLAIVTGMLSHMRIPTCNDPLRVYGASIEESFLDGSIEGDHALFEDVVFGVHSQTDLLAWDSQIFTSNFCVHSRTLRLSASVFVICPSCAPEGNLIACADSQAVREIKVSDCNALLDPEDCGGAIPERPLPP